MSNTHVSVAVVGFFLCAIGAERPSSPAAGSRSGAEASGSQVQRQTVSKVDFLKMRSNKINSL
jgi:hypothetical protein